MTLAIDAPPVAVRASMIRSPSAAGSSSRDVVALAVVAAIAPFDVAMPVDGWGPLNARPLMCVAIAVSVAVLIRQRSAWRFGPLDAAVALWLGAAWASAATSAAPVLGAAGASRFTMLGLLVLATCAAVRTDTDRRAVLRGVVGGTVVAGAIGLVVFVAGHDVVGTEHFVGSIGRIGRHGRLTRPWSHPNVAGMAIAAALPAALLLGRTWRLAAFAVAVPALVLTVSRGALVAFVASAIVIVVARRTSTDLRRLGALVAIVVALMVLSTGWAERFGASAVPANAATLVVPERISLGPDGATADVTVSNVGSRTWLASGPGRTELAVRWVGDGQDWMWGQHRWPLPDDVAPGESVQMVIDMAATIPVGTYEVRWRVVGVASAAGAPTSVGVVTESSVRAGDVEPIHLGARTAPLTTRAEIWGLAVDEFVAAPLLGVGPSELGVAVADEIGTALFPGRHAHSSVLEPLATTGLLGAAPLFFVVAGAIRSAARRTRRWQDPIALVTLAGLVAVVVHGLFDWFGVYTSAAIPIALLTGIAWTWRDPATIMRR